MIKGQLAGDATVTESKELIDRATGSASEVDVVIETASGGHQLVVSIECRDHKRPQHVGWVREMHGKHLSLPTNLLVLASSSGFSKEAIALASSYGIGLIDTRSGRDAAERVRERTDQLMLRRVELKAETVRIEVASSPESPAETVWPLPENLVYYSTGRPVGPLTDIITLMQNRALADAFAATTTEDHTSFTILMNPVEVFVNEEPEPVHLFLERLVPTPHLKRIEEIETRGSVSLERRHIPLTHGEMHDLIISYGEVATGEGNVVVLRTADNDGGQTLSMRTALGEVEHLRPREDD